MKKSVIIVDLILIVLFGAMLASNIFKVTSLKMLQPAFMLFLAIHVAQHWKTLVVMTKNLFK